MKKFLFLVSFLFSLFFSINNCSAYNLFKSNNNLSNFSQLNIITVIPFESSDCIDEEVSRNLINRVLNKQSTQEIVIINKIKCIISNGIPSNIAHYNKPLVVYPSGYTHYGNNPYSISVYANAAVSHEDRQNFNFGQDLDQKRLDTVVKEILLKKPDAKIGFLANCAGSTAVLNYLANPDYNKDGKFKNVIGVALQSPGISFDEVARGMSASYLPKFMKRIIPFIFKRYFPNYKFNQLPKEKVLDSYSFIPAHVKIFLGCLKHDKTILYDQIKSIEVALKNTGKDVVVFESDNTAITHGYMMNMPEYRRAMHAFLSQKFNKN